MRQGRLAPGFGERRQAGAAAHESEAKEIGRRRRSTAMRTQDAGGGLGVYGRAMRCRCCGSTSACIRWMAWAWAGMRRRPWRPARWCITCAQTKQGALEHLDALRFYERRDCLELDAVSVRNLELVEPLFSSEGAQTTLLHTLDACCTPMGKRLLRASCCGRCIELRGDRCAAGCSGARLRRTCAGARVCGARWMGVLDLERLLGRVALDSAGPREVVALAATLALPAGAARCGAGVCDGVRAVGRELCREQASIRWTICMS